MPMTYIISVLLFVTHEHIITHQQSTFYLFIFLFIFFMVDAMFISSFFYLVLLSFSLASIQLFHPTHGLGFILCYLSWVYTFYIMFIPHCKYFFLSSCTRNMAHNAVNTRSQSLLHRKYTCTRPVRQMPFGVTTLKIEEFKCCVTQRGGMEGVVLVWLSTVHGMMRLPTSVMATQSLSTNSFHRFLEHAQYARGGCVIIPEKTKNYVTHELLIISYELNARLSIERARV